LRQKNTPSASNSRAPAPPPPAAIGTMEEELLAEDKAGGGGRDEGGGGLMPPEEPSVGMVGEMVVGEAVVGEMVVASSAEDVPKPRGSISAYTVLGFRSTLFLKVDLARLSAIPTVVGTRTDPAWIWSSWTVTASTSTLAFCAVTCRYLVTNPRVHSTLVN
jgi:hypothetical protein